MEFMYDWEDRSNNSWSKIFGFNASPVYQKIIQKPDEIEIKVSMPYVLPRVEQVIFNEESATTVIIWADGKKTIVHCGEGETFDRYTGFMAAVCKRLFGGTTTAKKLMNSLDKQYQAKLKAEAEAKEKAKRMAEQEEARKKAEARHAKENDMLLEAMVEHYLLEAEAKQRAAEILAARDTSALTVPFEAAAEAEGEKNEN
jgi:hypothetical protein